MYNNLINNRQSVRLKNYDYSSEWLYFITISVHNKLCLFWNIKDWNFELFDSWKMIRIEWMNLENKYANIKLHNFVVMPNHFHGIIEIIGENDDCDICRGKPCVCLNNTNNWPNNTNNFSNNTNNLERVNTRFTPTWWKFNYNKNSISAIIQWFKSITTNEYIKNVRNNNWWAFNKILWQRNYYEHIIRDEESYNKIVEYIENNPKKWDEDKFYYTEI